MRGREPDGDDGERTTGNGGEINKGSSGTRRDTGSFRPSLSEAPDFVLGSVNAAHASRGTQQRRAFLVSYVAQCDVQVNKPTPSGPTVARIMYEICVYKKKDTMN